MMMHPLVRTCVRLGVDQKFGNSFANRLLKRFYINNDRSIGKWVLRIRPRPTPPLIYDRPSLPRSSQVGICAVRVQDSTPGGVEIQRRAAKRRAWKEIPFGPAKKILARCARL